MQVRINETFDVSVADLKDAIEDGNGINGSIDIYEYVDIDASDIDYADADELKDLYDEMGDKEQAKFLLLIGMDASSDSEFVCKTIEDEMKMELILSKINDFTLDELTSRLSR